MISYWGVDHGSEVSKARLPSPKGLKGMDVIDVEARRAARAGRSLAKPASIFDGPPAATNTGYRPGQGSMGMGSSSVVPDVLRNQKPAGFTGKGPKRKKDPAPFNTVRGLY